MNRDTSAGESWHLREEGDLKLFIRNGGADSPREIVMRIKGDGRWFLWDQFLLPDIRQPKSADPRA